MEKDNTEIKSARRCVSYTPQMGRSRCDKGTQQREKVQ